jgi:hypothetical protein
LENGRLKWTTSGGWPERRDKGRPSSFGNLGLDDDRGMSMHRLDRGVGDGGLYRIER